MGTIEIHEQPRPHALLDAETLADLKSELARRERPAAPSAELLGMIAFPFFGLEVYVDECPCSSPQGQLADVPDPFPIENWQCPICGSSAVGHGIERRRVGRRPWRRRVHVRCHEGPAR